jgi:hypothetical protein
MARPLAGNPNGSITDAAASINHAAEGSTVRQSMPFGLILVLRSSTSLVPRYFDLLAL